MLLLVGFTKEIYLQLLHVKRVDESLMKESSDALHSARSPPRTSPGGALWHCTVRIKAPHTLTRQKSSGVLLKFRLSCNGSGMGQAMLFLIRSQLIGCSCSGNKLEVTGHLRLMQTNLKDTNVSVLPSVLGKVTLRRSCLM